MRPRQVSDEAILDAARACLLADGPGVSVSVIAARVGVSGPAVLKRFGSKEQLVTRALLSEAPPDLSKGPEAGPLRPQLVAILLRTERLLLNAAPQLATMRAGGVRGSQWLGQPHPRLARESLLRWLTKARDTHGLSHPDLEAAADLLTSLAEARGFLSWVDPSWVKPSRQWASRAVDAVFADMAALHVRSVPRSARRPASPKSRAFLAVLGLLLLVGAGGATAEAQSGGSGPSAVTTPALLATPPAAPAAPVAPAVITRNAEGQATVRAVRVAQPLRVDGRLDEPLYQSPAVTDFIQVEPRGGEQATERTELWVSFDDVNVYVSFRNWESQPDRLIANEMRRDNTTITMGNDNIAFLLDTFYDRRNAMLFETNPLGARMDGQLTNERPTMDLNPVWQVKTGRFEGGWTVEAAVPFKSLRYGPARQQVWGFNARRVNRAKNEVSFVTRLSKARGIQATFQVGQAATLVGIEAPPRSRNLEVKPYAITSLTTNNAARPRVLNDPSADVGVDVKYGITQNLTADFTYNTDFAQVEADEQQVNLTRFNLFFPEKREFFLENQGIFAFGGAAVGGLQAAGGDTPILFYSRRVGLDRGQSVPIDGGGRLTGRVGRFTIGALNIHTDDGPSIPTALGTSPGLLPTRFSVVRLRRDIFRRSNVGVMLTDRSVGQAGNTSSTVYGADGTLGFYDNLAINAYWAASTDAAGAGATGAGGSRDRSSYRAQLDYPGDRYGVQVEHLAVGARFNPEVGFLRRSDIRKSLGQLRFSPRPRRNRVVRKYSWTGTAEYIENYAGRVEWRNLSGEFGVEFQNSDQFRLAAIDNYEYLPAPFAIARGVTLPRGGYDARNIRATYQLGLQRAVSGTLTVEQGSFYSGHKTTVGFSRGRTNLSSQLSVEPSYTVNRVDLPEGAFDTHLAGSRVTYTITPLMFASALVQYNSGTRSLSTNARLRWEYRPGSELFVVYNDDRDTAARGFPNLATRSFIVKVNRLMRP